MYNDEAGQTLLELIVVVAVSVIVVGALVFAIVASLRNAQFAKNQSLATKLAQDAIEKARVGRDRDLPIHNFSPSVSWNGTGSNDAIWDRKLADFCETEQPRISNRCYFKVEADGSLRYFASYDSTKLPDGSEIISPIFTRAIILSNDINGNNNLNDDPQPPAAGIIRVTSIVSWTDFSGTHQSRLSTILRRVQ